MAKVQPTKEKVTPGATIVKKHLSDDQILEKAEELSKVYGPVTPLVFIDADKTGDQIVGYLKNPSREVKFRILDRAVQSPTFAAAELLEVTLIREASDFRILDPDPKYDEINLGAVMESLSTIKYLSNTFKKK